MQGRDWPGKGPFQPQRFVARYPEFQYAYPNWLVVTQQYVEIVSTGDPSVDKTRSTQQFVEVVTTGDPTNSRTRITQQWVEVVHKLNLTYGPFDYFVDTDTFYRPTVTSTAHVLPSLFVDSDAFYSPVISWLRLQPGLFSDADTFFAPIVAGRSSIAPSRVVDVDQFYAPAVRSQALLLPSLFIDSDAFYAPTTRSQNQLLPLRFIDSDIFYSPSLAQIFPGLAPALFVDTDHFYAPRVWQVEVLQPQLLVDADIFRAPVITRGARTLFPPVFNDQAIFYPPTVAKQNVLQPPLVSAPDTFYRPAIAWPLKPSKFIDTDLFRAPVVTSGTATVHPSWFRDVDRFWTAAVQAIVISGGGGTGGGQGQLNNDIKYAVAVTAPFNGVIVYCTANATSAGSLHSRMAVYAAQANGEPGALLGSSAIKTAVVAGSNRYDMITAVPVANGQVVWIALQVDSKMNWFLANSPSGARYNQDAFADGISNPFGIAITDNKKAPLFAAFYTSPSATELPPSFADRDIFYSPSAGTSNTLHPVLFGGETVLPPHVSAQNTLAPSRVDASEIIRAPVVSTQAAIVPFHIFDFDNFYSPGVGRGAGFIEPTKFFDLDSFYRPTITADRHIAPPLFAADDQFYRPVVSTTRGIAPSIIPSDDAIYLPRVHSTIGIAPPFLDSPDDFFTPDVERFGGTQTLAPSLFIDAEAFEDQQIGFEPLRRIDDLSGTLDQFVNVQGTALIGAIALSGSIKSSVELEGSVHKGIELAGLVVKQVNVKADDIERDE
jgi:hypothetical protein